MAPSALAGKTVVVTGGGSGIGLAIVKYFASQTSKVTLLDISKETSLSVLSSLHTEFPNTPFTFKQCDISDWDAQKRVFEEIYREAGKIDIVIANAGISEKGNFLSKDEKEPQKPNLTTLDVNLTGTLYTIKLAIHYMRKNTSAYKGSIVCTASNAGLYPLPIAPVYAMSKHAIVGAVRSLARPLKPEGIQINGLAPAVIATNLAPDTKLFDAMILTPVSTAVNAVEEFVTKTDLSGIIAEISGDNFTFRDPPEFVDEDTAKNIETFWQLGYA